MLLYKSINRPYFGPKKYYLLANLLLILISFTGKSG
ncbi:MAG: hypothetical protein ACI9ES_002956, partial [Oceanospirillaceae bacterium]